MDTTAERLLDVLEDEVKVHEQLTDAAKRMNRELRAGSAAEVPKIAASYDAITCHIEELEEKRLEICDALASRAGIKSRHVNLSVMAGTVPEAYRGRLGDIRDKLKQGLSELSTVNTSNQLLLRESLGMIARTVRMIAQPPNPLAGYKREGTIDTRPLRRTIFNRVV